MLSYPTTPRQSWFGFPSTLRFLITSTSLFSNLRQLVYTPVTVSVKYNLLAKVVLIVNTCYDAHNLGQKRTYTQQCLYIYYKIYVNSSLFKPKQNRKTKRLTREKRIIAN